MKNPIDRNGNEVNLGDKVKVISFDGNYVSRLVPAEQEKIKSMIGEIFTVDEIDEYGGVWVHKVWLNEKGDESEHRGISLSSEEMERVDY